MRRLLLLGLLLWLAPQAAADVAFDAFSTSGIEADPSWTHTPVGTPRGAVVGVLLGTGQTVSGGCTYGGVSMTFDRTTDKATGETGSMHQFFLGSSLPTGAQTVSCGTGGNNGIGYVATVTAGGNVEVVDSDGISSDSAANPSVTLSAAGRVVFSTVSFISGQDAVSGIAPAANWTGRSETDAGTISSGSYTFDTVGTSDVSCTWTQTAEDAIAVCIAIAEVAAAGTSASKRLLRGVGGP